MSTRQGSASFTLVIAGVAAIVVGALTLTFVVFPIHDALTGSAFWGSASTAPGARFYTVSEGLLRFAGAIIMIALLSYVWINTRQ